MNVHVQTAQPGEAARAFLAGADKQLLIGGAWRGASDGGSFETCDPASGMRLARLAKGTATDADEAVAAARAAFDSDAWRGMTPSSRGKLLWRIADLIDRHADELSELEVLDQGKPLKTARFGKPVSVS